MRRFGRPTRPNPPAPRNVRIVRLDGSVIPCELVYEGRNRGDDGKKMDEWAAVTRVAMGFGDRLLADAIPPRCSIRVEVVLC